MSENEQHTFNTPELSWKMKTTNAIKSWIQKHKPLMQMAVRAAEKRQKLKTPDIRTHLTKIMKRRKTKCKTSSKHTKPKTKKTLRQSMLHKMPGFTTSHNQTVPPKAHETSESLSSQEISPDRSNHRKMHDPMSINFDLCGGSTNLT